MEQNGSVHSVTCVVCGRRTQSNHHVQPKGMGGREDEGPTLSVCGVGNEDTTTCHGAAHQGLLKFKRLPATGMWVWSVGQAYAAVLRKRGIAAKDGLWYAIKPVMEEEPEIDEKLGEILDRARCVLSGHRFSSAEYWREDAELLWLMVWKAVEAAKGGEAKAFFKEWCADNGVTASTASKMKKVVETLPNDTCRHIPWTQQYNLARVWDEYDETLLEQDAIELSVSDFAEKYGLKSEPKALDGIVCPTCQGTGRLIEPEPTDVCPTCGSGLDNDGSVMRGSGCHDCLRVYEE